MIRRLDGSRGEFSTRANDWICPFTRVISAATLFVASVGVPSYENDPPIVLSGTTWGK